MRKPKQSQVLELEALGTRWWVEAVCEPKLLHEIEHTIKEFECDYSRFLPESFIGRLNDQKVLKNPPVELVKMLNFQRDMFYATNGVFNCTVGGILEKQGYGLSGRQSSLQRDIDTAITINEDTIELSKDTRIDLGGFGKGWLIDKIGSIFDSHDCREFVINGGGDILVGSEAEDLYIEHPNDPESYIGLVTVQNGALASSSAAKRRWKVGVTEHSHIVDTTVQPLKPTEQLASVHVRAESALLADTLATVFLLVDHQTRIQLAKKFDVTFLEVRSDDTLWAPSDFGFKN